MNSLSERSSGLESTESQTCIIRKMTPADLPQVLAIEQQCFEEPWPKSVFLKSLEMHKSAFCLVASRQERVVGFIIAWYIPPYSQERSELHIHNIAVEPGMQRQGMGKQLLLRTVEGAVEDSREVCLVSLEVRESNTGAQEFYRCLGFGVAEIRPRYYKDEGALLMEARCEDVLNSR